MTTPRPTVGTSLAELCAQRVATRIWAGDPSLWQPAGSGAAAAATIEARLGWLRAPVEMLDHVEALGAFAEEVHRDGLREVYHLGMGGSSLCALLFRDVLGISPDGLGLHAVDTTDDELLSEVTSRLEPATSLVIVASKSGTTVEVDAMARLFEARLAAGLGPAEAARHLVAITDAGSPLDHRARAGGYRQVFHNPADIGGRFSALSFFGLVPAALMGHPPASLLREAQQMADACRRDDATNPGLALGAFLVAGARAGRDKLTLLLPERLAALGLWIEQLVAESTGKDGRGLLPVVDEPWDDPDRYGPDRLFVIVECGTPRTFEDLARALARRGHPVFPIETTLSQLGGELFRWEFAVAVAGVGLGINPFDEPDVQAAKDRTRDLLAAYARSGTLPAEVPAASADGIRAHSTLGGTARTPAELVRAALATVRPGDYLALLSYLSAEEVVLEALRAVRASLGRATGVATTLGLGPRYLHSTGQFHKGGPNSGVFFLLTADARTATPVPGLPYSFAVLRLAQAVGDYQALAARGRRVVRIHLPTGPGAQAAGVRELFESALR